MSNKIDLRKTKDSDERITLCIRTAKAFLKMGKFANYFDLEKDDPEAMYMAPGISNISLACEMAIKSIVLLSDKKVKRTHNLDELFNMIPSDKREILQENFDKKCKFEGSLEETIQYHQNTFNEWRYIYESKDFKADAYIDKLILATEVMINYADEIHCIRKCLPNDLMGIFSKS